MLTFRGAPSGKGLEAWRDNFSLKVGVVRIRAPVSKKYPIGKEGAQARGPLDLGPWAQIWAPTLFDSFCDKGTFHDFANKTA